MFLLQMAYYYAGLAQARGTAVDLISAGAFKVL
jgi:hypothetical protein